MKSKIVRQSAAILAAVQSNRGRQAFVWSVWLVMMAIALVNLVKYGRNIPLAEDWLFVAPLTGHESNLLHWLWSQNNEHRIPLFRLIVLILLKLTHGDFRVGMFLSIISLGGLSLAMLQVAQSLRGGRTRFVDAFFPITLLHLGHWENLFWSWQFNFVLSVVLTGVVLLILVSQRFPMTPVAAIIAGVCLMLLPLCGATGLLFAPFLALWFGYCGLLHWNSNWRNWTAREPEGKTRWSGRFLIGSAVVALCLTGLYFVGYERPAWTPPNPGPGPSLWAALQFLALGWGPIARSSWLLSTIGIMGLLIPSAAMAGFGLLRHRGPERHRALGIFVFFGTLIVFALGMGWGRAGTIAIEGNWPIGYVLLAVPTLWIAFFIWELYASPKVRLVAQGSLFLGLVLLLPFNTVHGLDWRDYYRQGMRRVEQDLRVGTPPSILAERHLKFLIHWWDAANLEAHMRMLYDAGSGPFAQMRVAPARPKTLSPRVLSHP